MTDTTPCGSDRASAMDDEAVAWFTRLRGSEARQIRPEFEQWLAADPAHRQAYGRIADLFGDAGLLKRSRRYGHGRAEPCGYDQALRRWGWELALAAAIALALVMGIPRLAAPEPLNAAQASDLASQGGEIRMVRLDDGSTVTLDARSRVEVILGNRERRLQLVAGRVRFAVARDPRPFIVEAGSGRIVSHDATFDVGFEPGAGVGVVLVRGSAQVVPRMQLATWQVPLHALRAGQSTYYRADGSAWQRPPGQIAVDRRDWPSGWAEYRSVTLGTLVADANRYAGERVVIDDPQVGSLAVSGRFRLTDPAGLAARLAEVFDLALVHAPDGIHLEQQR